jgi:hypothetical protein
MYSSLNYYVGKLFSLKGLLSLGIFILMKYQEEVMGYLHELVRKWRGKKKK